MAKSRKLPSNDLPEWARHAYEDSVKKSREDEARGTENKRRIKPNPKNVPAVWVPGVMDLDERGDMRPMFPIAPALVRLMQNVPKLSDTDVKIAEYIHERPGCNAEHIAGAVGVSGQQVRRIMSKKLSQLGYHNKPGKGYFPPPRPV